MDVETIYTDEPEEDLKVKELLYELKTIVGKFFFILFNFNKIYN